MSADHNPLSFGALIDAQRARRERIQEHFQESDREREQAGDSQRIRAERLRQNLTLRQLSDRTDLTTSQLSQVELGKNAASIWALARISNSLGLRLSVLLSGL